MNHRFIRTLCLLVILTQNIYVIETAEITTEGRHKDANTTLHIVEKLKDEKSNSSNVSALPIANNDTLVSFLFCGNVV
jgi:hypothetical protein